jgi:hypothetical protein
MKLKTGCQDEICGTTDTELRVPEYILQFLKIFIGEEQLTVEETEPATESQKQKNHPNVAK